MITGKNSFGKGTTLFIGTAIVVATSFVTLSQDGLGFTILGCSGIISSLLGAGKIYKSLSR